MYLPRRCVRLQCFMQAGRFLAFPLTDTILYVLDLTLRWYFAWHGDFGSRHAADTYTRVLEAGDRHSPLKAASGSHVVQSAATCGLLHMDDHFWMERKAFTELLSPQYGPEGVDIASVVHLGARVFRDIVTLHCSG